MSLWQLQSTRLYSGKPPLNLKLIEERVVLVLNLYDKIDPAKVIKDINYKLQRLLLLFAHLLQTCYSKLFLFSFSLRLTPTSSTTWVWILSITSKSLWPWKMNSDSRSQTLMPRNCLSPLTSSDTSPTRKMSMNRFFCCFL